MVAMGATIVTGWIGCELVYQMRLALDDDGGLVPFPDPRPEGGRGGRR
jgi:hypothetical protein